MAYQFEGIVHGPGGDLIQPITRCKPYGGFTVGQQDCNSVYSETGRFALSRSTGRNKETFVNNVKTKHTHRTLFHSGEVQFPGRRSVSPGSYPRLAPSPFSDGVSLSTLGGAKHRFVCDPQIESCAALCDPESPGQQGGIHRCLLKKVGFQASVGLPAPASTSSSIASLERRPGLICNSSSSVAEGLLVSRLEGAGNSPPNNGSRPQIASDRSSNGLLSGNDRRHDIGNLANTGWVNQVEGWSESDKRVLTAAWRPSTRSTYQKPWARWLSWSSTNAVDPRNPSPHHLARFLAYLFHTEKLSLSTILLHRSVVVTLSNPDSSMNLSSHPVVTKMIKGISASQVQRSTRSIWDVSTLLNWMENNSPSSSSFFELSRYLALLLLLASGRRVHDLTLLQCDSEHLQRSTDFVMFWPRFGSKSDSRSFQQAGWRFSLDSTSSAWNLLHWLDLFLDLRQARCGSLILDSLFISTRGVVRPASRAIIAGWIKTALSAGIPFPSGSIRSAVNTSLAQADLPLDSIMARGNWRSADTFLRHYYRPLDRPSSSQTSISKTFHVQP